MPLQEVGVGQPYTLVQNAINAAANGDHVRVSDPAVGLDYAENLSIVSKRIRLSGKGVTATGPRIGIIGAGGANQALVVSGTGGVFLSNLRFSNAGAAAGIFIVELNVAEDWISQCVINGDGNKKCLQAQFADNCILFNGTTGLAPSCPGQNLFFHFTAVNHSVAGITCNVNAGELVGCLAYNCNGVGFSNAFPQYSMNCASDDLSGGNIPQSQVGLSLANIDFVNYAGNDFRLGPNSVAWFRGMAIFPNDYLGNRRVRETGLDPRVYAGAHDPWPLSPVFLTGISNIRSM